MHTKIGNWRSGQHILWYVKATSISLARSGVGLQREQTQAHWKQV